MTQMKRPELRPADNKDCDRIAELVFEVLREYKLEPDPESTDADLKNIEESYSGRAGSFYVLEDERGAIIGAYGLYPLSRAACELRKMYLQKSFRGKGLGKMLLEDALARARRMGFEKMTLETASVLVEAIGLYKRYGFVEYEPEHLSARCDQAFVLELK
jgi:putative acetyltransferase